MFPADAGMNRTPSAASSRMLGVPRRRGDEPMKFWPCLETDECSPQTRG